MKSFYQYFKDQDSINNFLDCDYPAEMLQCYLEHKYLDIPDKDLYYKDYLLNRIDVEDAGFLISPIRPYTIEDPDYKKIIMVEFYGRKFLFSKEANNIILSRMDKATVFYYRIQSNIGDCNIVFNEIHKIIKSRIELDNMNFDFEE